MDRQCKVSPVHNIFVCNHVRSSSVDNTSDAMHSLCSLSFALQVVSKLLHTKPALRRHSELASSFPSSWSHRFYRVRHFLRKRV